MQTLGLLLAGTVMQTLGLLLAGTVMQTLGLLLAGTVMQTLGLEALIDNTVRLGDSAGAGREVSTLVG